MGGTSKKKECMHGKTAYSHEAKLCLLNKCMICNDGKWITEKV
jgi:hypothetical protein